MAVKLRLRRMGRRKRPIWSIVAADGRFPRDGRHIEDLGRYFPLEQPARVQINEDRVLYWLEQGARPSDTVRSILSKQGLMLALHLRHKGAADEEVAQAVAQHREQRAEKDQSVKITAEDRRRQMLDEERQRVEELEAEEAEKRRKAEAERKRQEAEAKAKAEAEAKAKAEAEAAEEAEEAETQEAEQSTNEAGDGEEADAVAEAGDAKAAEAAGEEEAAPEEEAASEEAGDEEEKES